MKTQWKYLPKILFYNLRNNNNKQNAKHGVRKQQVKLFNGIKHTRLLSERATRSPYRESPAYLRSIWINILMVSY